MDRLKVGFVTNTDPASETGGGGMVYRELLASAEKLGHEVMCFYRRPHLRLPRPKEPPDGWILADLHVELAQRGALRRSGKEWVSDCRFHRFLSRVRRQPYIHYDNAYVDVCNKGYLPCEGVEALDTCPVDGGTCFRRQTERLYRDALACVFLSPLHERVVRRLQPGIRRSIVLRPTFDPKPFASPTAALRDIDYLYVGALVEAKGADRLAEYDGLTVLSAHRGPVQLPNATFLGSVSYQDLPAVYARAQTLVFRPRWPDPLARVVGEAKLAGCKLELDGQIGLLSFPLSPEDPRLYEGAAEEFWSTIADVFARARSSGQG